MVIIDTITRLIPGVLGDERSKEEESFTWGILDYPQYTRPPEFRGLRVPESCFPEIIRISIWRRKEALRRTMLKRPDLIGRALLTDKDHKLVSEIKEEEG